MRAPARSSPASSPQAGDPEISEAAQLDDHALVQRLEPEPGLEIDVVRAAQAGVGGTQPLARLGRLAFGRGASLAVDGVGGADLLERRPSPRLRRPSSRPSRPQRVPRLGQRPLAFAQRADLAIGAGHPLLGQRGRCLGPGPPLLRLASSRLAGAGIGGQSIAPDAQLRSARLPGGQRGPVDGIAGGLAGLDRGGGAVAVRRGHGRAGALELGSQSLGLRLVPGRLPDDRLQPSRREPFRLLGRPPFPTGPALLGAGGLDGGRGGLRAGGGADGSRPQVRDLAIERRRLSGQALALRAPFEDRLGGTERDPEIADHRGPVARHGDPAGRQHRLDGQASRQVGQPGRPGQERDGPLRRCPDGPRESSVPPPAAARASRNRRSRGSSPAGRAAARSATTSEPRSPAREGTASTSTT